MATHRPPIHRPRRVGRVIESRPTSSQRGYGADWQKLRLVILAEEPLCRACRREPSTDVDHIVPRESGGTDERTNLQGLCHECHSRKTVREDGGFGRGKL